jgi:RNA polymerase sigma-70 factor (ECF subfamily)
MKNPGYNLIDEFRKGDKRAFGYIYKKYNPLVFFIAQKYISNKDIALDIAAECFVKLWQKTAEFESEDHIKRFLIIVARNASIDYLRVQKNRKEQSIELPDDMPDPNDQGDIIAMQADAYDILYQSIDLLPKKCRNIVKLVLLGQTTDEIAGRFNISPKTVRSQKARAIELLKNIVLKELLLVIIIGLTIFYLNKNSPSHQSSLLRSFGNRMVSVENYQA